MERYRSSSCPPLPVRLTPIFSATMLPTGFLLEIYEAHLIHAREIPDGEFALFWGDDHEHTSDLGRLKEDYFNLFSKSNVTAAPHHQRQGISVLPAMLQVQARPALSKSSF